MKMKLKGRHFNTCWDPKQIVKGLVLFMENYFEAGFEKWQECWDLAAQGDYFKGDDVEVHKLFFIKHN